MLDNAPSPAACSPGCSAQARAKDELVGKEGREESTLCLNPEFFLAAAEKLHSLCMRKMVFSFISKFAFPILPFFSFFLSFFFSDTIKAGSGSSLYGGSTSPSSVRGAGGPSLHLHHGLFTLSRQGKGP